MDPPEARELVSIWRVTTIFLVNVLQLLGVALFVPLGLAYQIYRLSQTLVVPSFGTLFLGLS